MASSFKTIDPKDVVSTRTLLHEAIPLTGTIVNFATGAYVEQNIKNFAHGMFQSVYDYPYLSSSANHILDISYGYSSAGAAAGTTSNTQNTKKVNIYNEMAQILAGFDQNGNVRRFDKDGDLTGGAKVDSAFFLNFTRLLTKDEIKKGSFSLELGVGANYDITTTGVSPYGERIKLTDASGSSGFKVNSPAGEYGLLWAQNTQGTPLTDTSPCGLIYYQAGICVVTGGVFKPISDGGYLTSNNCNMMRTGVGGMTLQTMDGIVTGSAISGACDALRHRIYNLSFNNTTELNSTIYFCRANHNDFNYSSNPTYLSASKMVIKNNSTDSPVSYATAVGLYSADNELLAVAKLSEPLKKDPSSELTLRVRLDY
tara:strand:- start:2038 stop:3147 length:1110 start_codon:yes stop_codon:yes gene_type:complete